VACTPNDPNNCSSVDDLAGVGMIDLGIPAAKVRDWMEIHLPSWRPEWIMRLQLTYCYMGDMPLWGMMPAGRK
jgi:hypothetical protein